MAQYPEGLLVNGELVCVAPEINPWTEIMIHMADDAVAGIQA
jgi:hypothetical protein